jgi:hypothetical protein
VEVFTRCCIKGQLGVLVVPVKLQHKHTAAQYKSKPSRLYCPGSEQRGSCLCVVGQGCLDPCRPSVGKRRKLLPVTDTNSHAVDTPPAMPAPSAMTALLRTPRHTSTAGHCVCCIKHQQPGRTCIDVRLGAAVLQIGHLQIRHATKWHESATAAQHNFYTRRVQRCTHDVAAAERYRSA